MITLVKYNNLERMMDLLEQCQLWSENGEYKKIIDAIEVIPVEERTTAINMELARGYLYKDDESDKDSLKTALSILLSLEEEMKDDEIWNYRVGRAYYELDQELSALPYFLIAAKHDPDDSDLAGAIEYCQRQMMLSDFKHNFKERTQLAWKAFEAKEAEIRNFMEQDKNQEHRDELIQMVDEALRLAFDKVFFEIGFNGSKYELILTPEGDRLKLFSLNYFAKRATEKVLKHWNILVGRQRIKDVVLSVGDITLSADDVKVLLEKKEENQIGLTLYCEKLTSTYTEDENKVWFMLEILTNQVLGELTAMTYIADFEIVNTPLSKEAILLTQLPDKLTELGLPLITDPESVLEIYRVYELEPNEDPEADWRMDTVVGNAKTFHLLEGYLENDNSSMKELYADGIAAGFLTYPLDDLKDEHGTDRIFDFRDSLIHYLEEKCGEDAVCIIGGATGIYYGYVDFIAWDLRAVLDAAADFFNNNSSQIEYATFHSFVRDARSLGLFERE